MDARLPETKAEAPPGRAPAARWALAIIALLVLAYIPLANLVSAAGLMLAVRALAEGSTGDSPGIEQARIARAIDGRMREALVYYPPDRSPSTALLLVAGISEKGCYHPRLMALARSLAGRGLLVLTPDIADFRRFTVPPGAMNEIADWFDALPAIERAGHIQRVGIAGISFSGTLSLMVAAREQIRDRVAFVLGIGAYQDLSRCARLWFSSGARTMSDGYFPTRYYGRWILMLSALEMLEAEGDRKELDAALRSLLLQGKVHDEPVGLTESGRRWLHLARMPEDESDAELIRSIENHLASYFRSLSPDEAASELRCPVFLAHGAYDDLIPPEESVALSGRISGAPVHLLISPFLTHTHPLEKQLGASEKIAAAWSMLRFFYSLSEAAR